ncbi:sensor histidine kinase [Spirosoma arcticum]
MMNWVKQLGETDRSIGDWLLRHSLYWLVFTLAVAVSWVYWKGAFGVALGGALLHTLTQYLPITYGLLYLVLPQLMQGQYRLFAIRLTIWLGASFALRYALLHGIPTNLSHSLFADSPLRTLFNADFMVTNSYVIVAASLKLFRYQYQTERANQELAQETLLIERQLLNGQVHPHFLFNTLNNIYSLTLRQSDQAGDAVQKLSALLGFMFREGDKPDVSLSEEIDLLRNYVALEQVRYGHRLTVTLTVEGALTNHPIAPLLLIPFVENAFKHGASEQTDQAVIAINIRTTGNILTFRITNSRNLAVDGEWTKPGGLGLPNVRKRLNLLYPDRHTLLVRPEAERYSVELTIQLNPVAALDSEQVSQQPIVAEAVH